MTSPSSSSTHTDSSDDVRRVLDNYKGKPITAANLRRLGDALAPAKKKIQAANAVAETIQQAVRECSTISIDRSCIGGSLGKRTALPSFDIDLVLFVNNETPPFEPTLAHLKEYLSNKLTGIQRIKSSPFSITFWFQSFKVDLLLAPNMVTQPVQDVVVEQRNRLVLDIFAMTSPTQREERARSLSAGFAESIVDFMKSKSPFVNAAVRIAKLWKHERSPVVSKYAPRWVSSYLLELVAIDAATTELRENPNNVSLMRVLQDLLQKLAVPQQLAIFWHETYEEIPMSIYTQRPLVMDPTSPWNVAESGDWDVIRLLALETLTVFDKAEQSSSGAVVGDLFCSRLGGDVSKLYRDLNFNLRLVKTDSWLHHSETKLMSAERACKRVTWRDESKLSHDRDTMDARPRILGMLESLVQVTNIAMAFHVTAKQKTRGDDMTDVAATICYDILRQMLSEVFGMNTPISEWPSSSRRPEDRDVTLVFGPFPVVRTQQTDEGVMKKYLYLYLSFDVDDDALTSLCHSIATDLRRIQEQSHEEYREEYE